MTARLTKVLATAVLLLCFLGAADAAAEIFSAWCVTDGATSACVDGTELQVKGRGLKDVTEAKFEDVPGLTCNNLTATEAKLRCTLEVRSNVADGSYALSLYNGGTVEALFYLLVGNFDGLYLTVWGVHDPLPPEIKVAGQSSAAVANGDEWCALGNYDTTKAYSVFFYNTESGLADSPQVPVCTATKVSAFGNSVCCTVRAFAGVMGKFRFLVKDSASGAFVPRSTVYEAIVVTPELPAVTGVVGDCAMDSTMCVDGAILTFFGRNFNKRVPEYNVVRIGPHITCVPTQVFITLQCKLSIPEGVKVPATWPVEVFVQLTASSRDLSPPQMAGTLAIQYSSEVAGWSPRATVHGGMVEQVTTVPPTPMKDGAALLFLGSFTGCPHTVEFAPIGVATSDGTPTCTDVVGSINFLTCVYHAPKTISGLWAPRLYNTHMERYTAIPYVGMALYPLPPTALTLDGDTGAGTMEVKLTGPSFHPDVSHNRIVTMTCSGTGCDVAAVSCVVKRSLKDTLFAECTTHDAADGAYILGVQTLFGLSTWYEPAVTAGYVYVKENVFEEVVASTHVILADAEAPVAPEGSSKGNPVAVGVAIALGIVVAIGLAALVVVLCRCRLVPRNVDDFDWEETGKGNERNALTPQVDQSSANV